MELCIINESTRQLVVLLDIVNNSLPSVIEFCNENDIVSLEHF